MRIDGPIEVRLVSPAVRTLPGFGADGHLAHAPGYVVGAEAERARPGRLEHLAMRHAAAHSHIAEAVEVLDRVIELLGCADADRTGVDRIEPLVRQARGAAVEAANELRGVRMGTEPGA